MSFNVEKRPVLSKHAKHHQNRANAMADSSQDPSRTVQIDRELMKSVRSVEEIRLYKTPRPQYKVNLDNELVKDPKSLNKKKVLLGADYLKEINEKNCIINDIPDEIMETYAMLRAFMKENQDKLDENVIRMKKTIHQSKLLSKSDLEAQRKATLEFSEFRKKLAPYHYPEEISFEQLFPTLFGTHVGASSNDDSSTIDESNSISSSSTFDDFYFDPKTRRFINRKHQPTKPRNIAQRLNTDLNDLDKTLYRDMLKVQKNIETRSDPARKDVRNFGMNHYDLLKLISKSKSKAPSDRKSVEQKNDGDSSIASISITKSEVDVANHQLDRAAISDDWELQLQKRSLKFESSIRDSEASHSLQIPSTSTPRVSTVHHGSSTLASMSNSLKTASALSPSNHLPTSPKPSHSNANPMHKRVKHPKTSSSTQSNKNPQSINKNASTSTVTADSIAPAQPDSIEGFICTDTGKESVLDIEKISSKPHPSSLPSAITYFVSSIGAVSSKKNVDAHAHEDSVPFRTSEARAAMKRSNHYESRVDRGYTSALPKTIVKEMFDKLQGEELYAVTKDSEVHQPLATQAISIRKAIEEDVLTFNEIMVKMSRRSVVNTGQLVNACAAQVERKEEAMKECIVMLEEEVLKQATRRDEPISSVVVELSTAESVDDHTNKSIFLTQS